MPYDAFDDDTYTEFQKIIDGFEASFHANILIGSAVEAMGRRWLAVVAYKTLYLYNASDVEHDFSLPLEDISTALTLGRTEEERPTIYVEGPAAFEMHLTNPSLAIELHREMMNNKSPIGRVGRARTGVSPQSRGGYNPSLTAISPSGTAWQTTAVVFASVVTLFFTWLGLATFLSVWVVLYAWTHYRETGAGVGRMVSASVLAGLGVLLYLYQYGHLNF